jgi:transcriptional regulator with XRE-family HTH domain
LNASLGDNIRAARKAAGMSQMALAQRANMSLNGIAQLEQGGRTDPHYSTLSRIATVLGVSVSQLVEGTELATPKDRAPSSPVQPSGAEGQDEERRRNKALDAIEALGRKRVERLLQEVENPNSDHFRNATVATLWVTDLEKERRDWADWAVENAPMLVSSESSEGVRETKQMLRDALTVSRTILDLAQLAQLAKRRIKAMSDQADDFYQRRLEKASREADEAQSHLQAASGF